MIYHNLRSSLGFLELGDPDGAWDELEAIPAELRSHPAVLRMRVHIYREKKMWMEMAEITRYLIRIEPNEPAHWIDRAWAERRHLGISVAENTLLRALEKFPNEAIIHYNLACYAAQQERLDKARNLLSQAIELDSTYKKLALEDNDLTALW